MNRIRCTRDISPLDCNSSLIFAITDSSLLVCGSSTDSFLAASSEGCLPGGRLIVVARGDGGFGGVPAQIVYFRNDSNVENGAGFCADYYGRLDFLAGPAGFGYREVCRQDGIVGWRRSDFARNLRADQEPALCGIVPGDFGSVLFGGDYGAMDCGSVVGNLDGGGNCDGRARDAGTIWPELSGILPPRAAIFAVLAGEMEPTSWAP